MTNAQPASGVPAQLVVVIRVELDPENKPTKVTTRASLAGQAAELPILAVIGEGSEPLVVLEGVQTNQQRLHLGAVLNRLAVGFYEGLIQRLGEVAWRNQQ